jgi:hypothetical protein
VEVDATSTQEIDEHTQGHNQKRCKFKVRSTTPEKLELKQGTTSVLSGILNVPNQFCSAFLWE